MATEPATIDLGLLDRDGPDRERPSGQRWRRHRARLRRWAPALVLLLVAPLAADAPPPGPRILRLWTLTGVGYTALTQPRPGEPYGSQLYVTDARTLTAYRIEDGSAAWRARILPAQSPGLQLVAGVPVVVTDGPRTTAYHPRTGRVLWRRPGHPGQEVAGALLMVAGTDGREAVTAVDPRTGARVGAVTAGSGVSAGWRAPDGTLHLFTLDRDGVLARQAMTTGAGTARSVRTRFVERLPAIRQNSVTLVDGLLLLNHRASAERAVAAYDPATLAHRWTVPEGYRTVPCGPVLCVHVAASERQPYRQVYGVDPRTGHRRWSANCTDAGVARQACSIRIREVGPGRLWLEATVPDRYTGGTLVTSWLADPLTGERLSTASRWGLRQAGAAPLLSRSDPRQAPDPPGGPLRWWWARGDSPTTEDAPTTVDAPTTIDTLGAVAAHTCTPSDPYLVCWTDGQGVSVWRLR